MRIGRILGIVLGLAAAPGCTGSLFQSKAVAPAVYLLSANLAAPAPPVELPARVSADLAVQRPRVRAGLNTDRIAVLYPDRRLDYFAGARWSGPIDEVLQDLAVQGFRTAAHLRNVNADASAFASGYWLEIEVLDFQAEYSGALAAPMIHVHLLARLGNAGDRRIIDTVDVSAHEPALGNRLTPIVDAYERATDAALSDLVKEVARSLAVSLEHAGAGGVGQAVTPVGAR